MCTPMTRTRTLAKTHRAYTYIQTCMHTYPTRIHICTPRIHIHYTHTHAYTRIHTHECILTRVHLLLS